ncbi:sugar phosphate isomerase/epimerase family protein [Membranihabitans maritimus]|uniref:sugar phosphate isomerase/epimerase family protein n=1 Tax=Membranihabitans maritimus TaxID=2904244 RepID=UPI001F2E1D65|nr:sugar phosphate isomerase/epimerase [Membranihabitans maritimus]
MNRRNFISTSAGAGIATLTTQKVVSESTSGTLTKRYQGGKSPWPICLDTATIRTAGSLEKKVDIAIQAGYDAIEPWDGELAEFEKNGGNLKELGQKIRDNGLFVPSMIGLWGCIPQNEEAFQQSLQGTRNRMRMAAEIGCGHVQAIPNEVGENYDHGFVTSCYRRLLEIGIEEYDIIPSLVFVKMFPLKTLGQAVAVALDADHPDAKVIPDVYHMYISKGGFNGLKKLDGSMISIFQFNDAPGGMEIDQMQDKHRVYPGDGILPLPEILSDLKDTGFNGCVSLELYNPEYHKQDLLQVAKTGLKKTLAVIEKAKV